MIGSEERGKFLLAKSSFTGLGALETDGDEGAEIPALRKAFRASRCLAFSNLSSSNFFRLSSLASDVKSGLFERVDEVDGSLSLHDMNL